MEQQLVSTTRGQAAALPATRTFGLGVVVAVAYFIAARLSLSLLTEPDGVATFWPAAGIASGALIALGPRRRLAVAIAVRAATLAANLLADRTLPGAVLFAICNAGEAIVIGGILHHYFGSPFRLDSTRSVVALFLAAALGTAMSGVGGTAANALFHNSGTPLLTTWQNWFAADALGVVTIAPVIIGLVHL